MSASRIKRENEKLRGHIEGLKGQMATRDAAGSRKVLEAKVKELQKGLDAANAKVAELDGKAKELEAKVAEAEKLAFQPEGEVKA